MTLQKPHNLYFILIILAFPLIWAPGTLAGEEFVRVGIIDLDREEEFGDSKERVEATIGDEGIYQCLSDIDNLDVEYIREITPAAIGRYDVIILPQTDPDFFPEGWRVHLSSWVREGHGLMTTHDAVGYRKFGKSLFPNVCEGGVSHKPFSNLAVVVREHPVAANVALKQEFQHSYYDHIILKAGPEGEVVLRDVHRNEATGFFEVGAPVLIAGKVDKGRYIASGVASGWEDITVGDHRFLGKCEEETAPKGVEKAILINSILWLAGRLEGPVGEEVVSEGTSLKKIAEDEATEDVGDKEVKHYQSFKMPLIPIPKSVTWLEDDLKLDASSNMAIYIDPDASEKAALGAGELCRVMGTELKRANGIQSIDSHVKNIIFVGSSQDNLVIDLMRRWPSAFTGDYALSAIHPGRQGYIIRNFQIEENGRKCMLIGGSDDQGALYGCYTMFQLIDRPGGALMLRTADIVDWPDFGFRAAETLYSFEASLWGGREFPYVEWMKKYIDFMGKRKFNVISLGKIGAIVNPKKPDYLKDIKFRELNEFAHARGIHLSFEQYWHLASKHGTGIKPIRPNCGISAGRGPQGSKGLCSGDDMLGLQRKALEEFSLRYRPQFFRFHCIDADPFLWRGETGWWMKRCEVCKAKYADDERWKRDVELIRNAHSAIQKGNPEPLIEAILWPYHAAILTEGWRFFSSKGELYKQYLTKVSANLPEDIFFALRECSRSEVEVWDQSTLKRRKFVEYYPYKGFGYWVASYGRDTATWFTGNKDDGVMVRGTKGICYILTKFIALQYAWNVKTPGYRICEDLKAMRVYNGSGSPTREPPFVYDVLVPMLCENIFGKRAAPYIEAALKTNIERNFPGSPRGGWHHSRWKVDVEKGRQKVENGEEVEPVAHYRTMVEEAQTMAENMRRAAMISQRDPLIEMVVRTFWYKSEELLNRCKGFYHWALAAAAERDGNNEMAREETTRAMAFFNAEWELMELAESEGLPSDVTTQLGYVPYYGRPRDEIRDWAKKKSLLIGEDWGTN